MTPPRTVGILPALGSGLTDLHRSGQHERLLAYDLRHYSEVYDRVYYFSYFRESLTQFTQDPFLLEKVTVLPKRGPWPSKVYALILPLIYRREFRECEALRVLQFPGVIPALVARLIFRVPFVVTYGYHYAEVARIAGSRFKPSLYWILERVAFPFAAGAIVTSREIESSLRSCLRASRLAYIPNGVDTAQFAPVPAEGPARPWRSVVYVGRLGPEKNLVRLIDALALIPVPPLRLVIIGDGRLKTDLKERARVAGVDIDFKGIVPHGELPKHLNEADLFVLPSLTEGNPKALIEAMASGLPCAVSARGGNLSLIEDGVTGLLFEPDDDQGIARVIHRLLTEPALARRLGEAARAAVVARYDVHALLKAEISFVQAVCAGSTVTALFEDYAEAFPLDDTVPEYVVERINELAQLRPRTVLDLGAGDGRFLGVFGKLLSPDALLVGCEISFRRAQRIKAKSFSVVVAQSEALPFKETIFDLVTLIEVIEHTQSPGRSLDEVRRVLRPGGRLALTTPNYPVKRLYDIRAALRARSFRRLKDDPTHLSPLSSGRLKRLLAARFESVSLEGTSILGENRSGWIRKLKGTNLGPRLSNKLFAVCTKGYEA